MQYNAMRYLLTMTIKPTNPWPSRYLSVVNQYSHRTVHPQVPYALS